MAAGTLTITAGASWAVSGNSCAEVAQSTMARPSAVFRSIVGCSSDPVVPGTILYLDYAAGPGSFYQSADGYYYSGMTVAAITATPTAAQFGTSISGLQSLLASQGNSVSALASQVGDIQGQVNTSLSSFGSTLASLQSTVATVQASSSSGVPGGSSPFDLSSADGGVVAIAIVGVWAVAYAFKAAIRTLDGAPE